MKKIALTLVTVLFLSACNTTETTKSKEESKQKQVATEVQISNDYYKTLLPFKESQARGLISTNMANGYNSKAFEQGLLAISREQFSPKEYYYRDGQVLTKNVVQSYLEPQFTKSEIDAMEEGERIDRNAYANYGLNPSHKGETDPTVIAEKAPAYLSHILEQNYYSEDDAKVNRLSGMTIGLAMNSVYYYQKEDYGETYSKKLDSKTVEKKGKEMAEEILSRLRVKKELRDIPITFAIFIQSSTESITPGHFVTYTVSDKGERLGKWKTVNEKYALVPSKDVEELNQPLNSDFKQFNDKLQTYFPTFTQAIGTGHFVDNQLEHLSINVPLDFYSASEVISVTQYIVDLTMKYFADVKDLEISIVDNEKPLALITKTKEQKEPNIHIYNQ